MKSVHVFLLMVIAPVSIPAHGVHASIEESSSTVVVRVEYGDGSPFAYEQYEVFGPGDSIPFMNGRTDARGRILYAPDREGDWRVRFFSQDGHGGEEIVPFTASSGALPPTSSDRLLRVTAGLGYLAGIFGFALFIFSRKRIRGG